MRNAPWPQRTQLKAGRLRPTILFVYNVPKKFVQIDRDLLRSSYGFLEWYQRGRSVNLFRLIALLRRSDIVFAWFASWHSLFPILLAWILRIPSILVVGGYDTAKMEEIGYGSQRGGFRGIVSRVCMALCSEILTFSDFSMKEAIKNARVPPDKIRMVYLGVPEGVHPACAKENIVLTVGGVEYENLKRKGLECFVRAAGLIPQYKFVVAGAWNDNAVDFLRSIAASNVEFTGWLSDKGLLDYFLRARVYVQASRHEGFGLAVAEAMLMECIPVVTRAGSLPEVVGNAGIYIDSTEPEELARGIACAFKADADSGSQARKRIREEFSLKKRKEELYAIIDSLLSSDRAVSKNL